MDNYIMTHDFDTPSYIFAYLLWVVHMQGESWRWEGMDGFFL